MVNIGVARRRGGQSPAGARSAGAEREPRFEPTPCQMTSLSLLVVTGA